MAGVLCFSHELAVDSRRSQPNILDLVRACFKAGVTLDDLATFHSLHPHSQEQPLPLEAPLEPPPPIILPYTPTEEEANARLDIQPDFFPPLPPEHTWKQTPVSSAFTRHLVQVEVPLQVFPEGMAPRQGPLGDLTPSETDNRVRTTRMVESSLRALIRNTNAALSAAPLAKAAAQQGSEGNDQLSYGNTAATTEEATGGDQMELTFDIEAALRSAPLNPPPSSTTSTAPQKPTPEAAKESLINLQLLASTNPDESLDSSVVNWQVAMRKRGVQAVDTNGVLPSRGRKIKWAV